MTPRLQVLAVILTFFSKLAVFLAYGSFMLLSSMLASFQPLIDDHPKICNLQTLNHFCRACIWNDDRDDYEPAKARPERNWAGNTVFEHVSFFLDGKRDVLKDISFEVKTTPSPLSITGSGKSSSLHALWIDRTDSLWTGYVDRSQEVFCVHWSSVANTFL